ncbi:MAG: D-2-hydroxyacid dehydrogenase [Lachnospiraceae bacterium]|nr:D-2-hydroxyacid dehydrogenase [Lachnospiraceae bacterium]
MSKKVIVTGYHTQDSITRFGALEGYDIYFCENIRDVADLIPDEVLEEAEFLVGGVNPELLEKMPNLKYVQLFSAGANNFGWLPEHIVLMNAYGAYGDAIAEHMLTTTLMAMKRMPEYLEGQKNQAWELLHDIDRLEGANVLSVGMGAIGTAYLKRVTALGAFGYGVRRTIHDVPDFVEKLVTPDEMDELLPEMNVVALSLPGTPAVENLFDERRLRLMKKSAIILNTGRGNSIVTEDLIKVMEEGHLKAACLDVMNPEPLPSGHPLWTAPRVYLTPHISGGFRAGVNYERVMDTAIKNLSLIAEGKAPIHIVDRELGY